MKKTCDSEMALKIVIVGDPTVGKSNLLSKYTRDQFFLGTRPTVGIEFANKTLVIDNEKVKVQIWDTAGQERFSKVSAAFYRAAVGALMVYDITKPETFQNIPKWITELENYAEPEIVKILVGNKNDLINLRAVGVNDATQFAQDNKMAVIETSALLGDNVDKAFESLIREIYKLMKTKPKVVNGVSFKLPEKIGKRQKDSSCSC